MRIYIAYKFRYVKDKEKLKSDLQELSDYFESVGHKAFILGRDVQKWKNHQYSKITTTLDIVKNIGKYNTLFVYYNSNVHTNGMPVEIVLARLFGLKIIFARLKGLRKSRMEIFANKVVEFTSLEDLKNIDPLN
jgi:hypothetical protein